MAQEGQNAPTYAGYLSLVRTGTVTRRRDGPSSCTHGGLVPYLNRKRDHASAFAGYTLRHGAAGDCSNEGRFDAARCGKCP